MTKEKCFENFHNLVYSITNNFFIWKYLQNSDNNSWFNVRSRFWWPVITNLQKEFLLELANVFDNDKRVFTIHSYLDFLSTKRKAAYKQTLERPLYKRLIKNLMARRWNYSAHRNEYFLNNLSELTKKFPIKYWEIERLLMFLVKVMNVTKKTFEKRDVTNYINNYSILKERTNHDTEFV